MSAHEVVVIWTASLNAKASLAVADVKGYQVGTPGKAEAFAAEAVEVSGAECVPLGCAVAGAAVGKPAAVTHRRVTGDGGGGTAEEAAVDINTGMVTLASYASADDAAAALKSVGEAVTPCGGGIDWTAGDEKLAVGKVVKHTAPQGGAEAVAFTAVTAVDGVDAPWKVVVFRQGATLAHFTVANAGSLVSGEDFAFPAALVSAQADRPA
ncbi:hypothetical protein ACFXDH_10535 [Streptomyces sp. NPDC059467]|uniref:hypothetical protein n=1 Tax=Streptomyces sp. NPDC059467 TaxID=3346844 RepID=UPI00367FF6D9